MTGLSPVRLVSCPTHPKKTASAFADAVFHYSDRNCYEQISGDIYREILYCYLARFVLDFDTDIVSTRKGKCNRD